MIRCRRKYSERLPTLNQLPSSSTTPPTRPPRLIQSTKTGIKEVFLFGGISAIAAGFQTETFAKSYPPATPLFSICLTSTTKPDRLSKLISADKPVVRKPRVTSQPLEK